MMSSGVCLPACPPATASSTSVRNRKQWLCVLTFGTTLVWLCMGRCLFARPLARAGT
jgi:hypothetical protein